MAALSIFIKDPSIDWIKDSKRIKDGEILSQQRIGESIFLFRISPLDDINHGLRKSDGQTGFRKNCKTPFFSRYSNFLLMGDWNWSKRYPVFFFLKNLNKYGRLRGSNFWPNWLWLAVWLSNGKIFLSI